MAPRRTSSQIDSAKCSEIAESCACFNFRKASRSVTQLFDRMLAPVELRSTQFVVLVASQVLGPCGFARLARELVMDRSTITRNLQPLLSQGYLKASGKGGRRGKTVEITAEGQDKLASAVPYWEKAQAQLMTRLGADFRRMMTDLSMVVSATKQSA